MPSTYKTPGVYIEEISTLPASIAQVETAIPAFIGYTERAIKNGKPLQNVPTKIDSLLEYEEYFGKGPEIIISVDLNTDNSVDTVSFNSSFCLYDSMRMFFSNGGGECYIVSVETYENADVTTAKEDMITALETLRKEDEPTLLLFPDAVNLIADGAKLGELQKTALKQCYDLQDRFCIFDLLNGDEDLDWENSSSETVEETFRNNIGVQYLKYGAVYYPSLKTTLSFDFSYENLREEIAGVMESTIKKNNTRVSLSAISNDPTYVDHLDSVISDSDEFDGFTYEPDDNTDFQNASLFTLIDNSPIDGEDVFNGFNLIGDLYDTSTPTKAKNQVKAKVEYMYYMIMALVKMSVADTQDEDLDGDGISTDDLSTKHTKLTNATSSKIYTALKTLYFYDISYSKMGQLADDRTKLEAYLSKQDASDAGDVSDAFRGGLGVIMLADGDTDLTIGTTVYDLSEYEFDPEPVVDSGDPAVTTIPFDPADSIYGDGSDSTYKAAAEASESALQLLYEDICTIYKEFEAEIDLRKENLEILLQETNSIYANIVNAINKEGITLPPSGSIAGIYAATDNERGVWVAPANRSVNSVVGPAVNITASEQEGLNVDPTAGKSINAIRSFTGRGTLVWGARTLAGNSNEWRYVPVRRLFNMIEESVKKATEFVVFEPNDKNTWVRTKAMIENFLNQIWKAGGLAGAKAEHAYIVKVGLGETMTSLDILEGRMIIEIHLAAVRPAEFIILRFMHKLQES